LQELDVAMMEFMDNLFIDGRPSSDATKLKAALDARHDLALRTGTLSLPRYRFALKELRKRNPSQHRLPVPEELNFAISGFMLHRKKKSMALRNCLDFSGYFRPSESQGLRTQDLIVPADVSATQMQKHVVIISAFEKGVPTKTGSYDETIILDDERCQVLGPLLEEMVQEREKQESSDEEGEDVEDIPLWDFSAAEFRRTWLEAVDHFGVSALFGTPYQNRHGGASRDRWLKLRSMEAVKKRGRWAQVSSLLRYEKSGKVQQVLNGMGKEVLRYGETLRSNFGKYVRSGTAPAPPKGAKVQ